MAGIIFSLLLILCWSSIQAEAANKCKVQLAVLFDRTYFTPHSFNVFLRPEIVAQRNSWPANIDLRGSYLEYASQVLPRFLLNDPIAKDKPDGALDDWTLTSQDLGREADVAKALRYVRKTVFKPENGYNSNRASYVLFFAGNDPVNQAAAVAEANKLKLAGVTIGLLGFGLNSYNRSNWLQIVSSPTLMLEFPSNNDLYVEQYVDLLHNIVCPTLYPLAALPPVDTCNQASPQSSAFICALNYLQCVLLSPA